MKTANLNDEQVPYKYLKMFFYSRIEFFWEQEHVK